MKKIFVIALLFCLSAFFVEAQVNTNSVGQGAKGKDAPVEVVTTSLVSGQTPFTNPPAAPVSGDTYVNSADRLSWVFDGTVWVPYPASLTYRIGKRVQIVQGIYGTDSLRIVCDSLIGSDASSSVSCDTLSIVRAGRYWYVSNNGNNNDCEKGNINKPCKDVWAARDSAISGDLVYVFKGIYTYGGAGTGAERIFDGTTKTASSIWKNGVTYFFDPDATVICKNWVESSQRGINLPLFYTNANVPEACTVSGEGVFITERGTVEFAAYSESIFPQNNIASNLVEIDNDEANFNFKAKKVSVGDAGFLLSNNGILNITIEDVVKGNRLFIQNNGVSLNCNYVLKNVIDRWTENPSLIALAKRTYGGLSETNYNRALIYFNSPNPITSTNINNAFIHVGESGLLRYQTSGGYNTVNVNNLKLVDIVKTYNPNTIAKATWTPAGIPVAGSTVTVAGTVYTFVSTLTGAANEVLISTVNNSVRNLAWAINNVIGQQGVTIGPTVVNTQVKALWVGPAGVLTVFAIEGGTAGNLITLSASAGTISSPTLIGGLDDNAKFATTSDGVTPGAGLWDAPAPNNTGSGNVVIKINNLESNCRLVNTVSRNYNSTKVTTIVDKGVVNSNNSLFSFTSSTPAIGNLAEFKFDCNLYQLGNAPVFTFNNSVPLTTNQVKWEISGNYISTSTTSPIISNLRTDSVNQTVLDKFKGVTGFTESITGTIPQIYRTMYSSANKAVGANVTNSISTLLVHPDIN